MAHDDVVGLDATMLRCTLSSWQRLAQVTRLEVEVGGTESNLACGLARFSLRVQCG